MPKDARQLSWRIDIGSLPARWRRAAFGLGCLVLLSGTAFLATSETRLDCARVIGKEPSCTLSKSPPLAHVTRFAAGSIARVEEVHESRSKGGGDWAVLILDHRGAQWTLASFDQRADAAALGTRVRTFLADSRAPALRIEPEHRVKPWIFLLFSVAFSLLLIGNAFSSAGRLRVEIDRLHGELRVRRRLFGLARGKLVRHRIADLADVRIEYGPVTDCLRMRDEQPVRGARLVFVARSGRGLPSGQDFLPGVRAFDEGVRLLREELGFAEPATPERIDDEPGADAGAPSPSPPRALTAPSARRGLPLVLLGLGLTVSVVLAEVIALLHENRTQGSLEIRAQYRCMFQGVELLPGGMMSTGLAPGRYEIRVFNSALPGGWESQFYDLEIGQSLVVTCRPSRRRPVPAG